MDFSFTQNLPYFFAIAAVIVVASYGIAINQLMGIRLQRPRVRLKTQDDIPPYLHAMYEQAASRLKALGFVDHHYQYSHDLIAHEHAEKWTRVMINSDAGVYAEISPASTFLDLPGYEIDLWSLTNDAGALLTVNGRAHTVLDEIPGAIVHDSMAGSLEDQYKAHLEEQKTFSGDKQFVITNAAGYVKIQQKLLDGYFLRLIKERAIVTTGNNQFRITFSKSLKLASQLIYGEKEVAKLMKDKLANKLKNSQEKTSLSEEDSTGHELDAEVQAYLRVNSAREKHASSSLGKVIMFLATLALSYFAFGLVFSFNSVIILLGVILLHEMGHIAAMHAFKYRDLQILFIPLLGAAAIGKKENVDVWKQVVVYLMGPLPGIVLGIALIAWDYTMQTPWLYETAVIMLIINYLNLLPVIPMDGGHIVRLTIMERFPTGKLVFSVLSVLAFVVGALILGEPVFWVLSILLLFTLPASFRETELLKELNHVFEKFDYLDSNSKIAHIFRLLRKPKFDKYLFAQKFEMVKGLTEVLLQKRHASKSQIIGLTGLYLAILLVTPPAIIVASLGISNSMNAVAFMLGDTPEMDWESQIAQTDDPRQRFEIMLTASRFSAQNSDMKTALAYLDRAEKTFAIINEDRFLAKLYDAYAFYHQKNRDFAQAENSLNKIFVLYEDISEKDYFLLANTTHTLAEMHYDNGKLEEFESTMMVALNYAANIADPGERFIISTITAKLLDYYFKKRNPASAQKMLQDLLPKLNQHNDPNSNFVTSFVHQELGWLYADKKEYDLALQHFTHASLLNERNRKEFGGGQTDTLEHANILLAKTAILIKLGKIEEAKLNIAELEKELKLGYFDSVENYINSYLSDTSYEELGYDQSRENYRWKLIDKIYKNFQETKLS